MRSFLTRALQCVSALAFATIASAATMNPLPSSDVVDPENPDINNFVARFGIARSDGQLITSPLLFQFEYPPTTKILPSTLLLNDQNFDLIWEWISVDFLPEAGNTAPDWPEVWSRLGTWVAGTSVANRTLIVEDIDGVSHDVDLTVKVSVWKNAARDDDRAEYGLQYQYGFEVNSIDGNVADYDTAFGFTLSSIPRRRLESFHAFQMAEIVPYKEHTAVSTEAQPLDGAWIIDQGPSDEEPDFDIEAEIEALLLLETQAGDLKNKIAAKKYAIGRHLRQHREHVSLKQLLQQCDGVMCAAKVIAQRICDKVGISTEPSFKYVPVSGQLTQHLLAAAGQESNSSQQDTQNYTENKLAQSFRTSSKAAANHSASAHLLSDKFAAGTSAGLHLDFSNPADALVKVLEIIATALGLVALFSFLHRKLMPMRKRVERDADREERRNARAYRRAARRAEMRLRWDAFVRSVNCFKPREEPRNDNYEDKRALILQDAFLEQDLDHAEKGEIMEAEIRELRNAHELVSTMVRGAEHRYEIIAVEDPPPPLVPLPFTPISRSRASSGTLPSYSSEVLPDYISRLDVDGSSAGNANSSNRSSSSSVVDGFPHYSSTSSSGSDDEPLSLSRSTAPSDVGSRRSRFTALSSMVDTSPRISEETLRTRQSKDTRYSREM